jgi:hypothetical protein
MLMGSVMVNSKLVHEMEILLETMLVVMYLDFLRVQLLVIQSENM